MPWIDGDDLRHCLNLAWEHLNSLRPPPSVDFSPTAEIYGIFALGHIAHLEGNRLSRRVEKHPNLGVVQELASWARREYRAGTQPEVFTTPAGRVKGVKDLDYTVFLVKTPADGFAIWRYDLRCTWANKQSRKAASAMLSRSVGAAAPRTVPFHDVALMTLFVSEELDGSMSSIVCPSFLRDKSLMVDFASFMSWSMIARWGSTFVGVLRTNTIVERYFICLLAFKWLGGRYCHYASIFGLHEAIVSDSTGQVEHQKSKTGDGWPMRT
ncbi:hypothetical protein GSI_07875 [Ganoderma sinense ZZ0214-1]|uniref:Uncharacterized protein n=1 Tax=Ganoderma sinense ZZ0214-1 TaxID=1077348 RepID=A0A2G8S898_9APHY|nr:hypothetical protein GSI_07875 [Ganoderma sinense ZZ0214-1]